MKLQMDPLVSEGYHSNSQKIRVMTEDWAGQNIYCPCCGNEQLHHFENNKPVADFFCPHCREEYELKSKAGKMGSTVSDGAYDTMISRIHMSNNPHFFFMSYDKSSFRVQSLILVPKYFFVPDIIMKRPPLAETARRAGWIGCNIMLEKVPEDGKIYLVKDSTPIPTENVIKKVEKTKFIAEYRLSARGWILDILNCIERVPQQEFTLNDLYSFEEELGEKYPANRHIREKIRQQLQVLRDRGMLEFQGQGRYRKIGSIM